MRAHTETYDRIGDVRDLGARPRVAAGRRRRRASGSSSPPDEATLIVSVPTDVPPQVAWEFITKPGQRMSWQPWVTEVTIKGATGGRRGPGSANHCRHGKDAVVEEILDWRPYDYVTDRTVLDTPTGPIKLLHTVEFEPTTTGTTIHFRYRRPEDQAGEGAHEDDRAGVWSGPPVGRAQSLSPSSTPSSRPARPAALRSPSSRGRSRTGRSPGSSHW